MVSHCFSQTFYVSVIFTLFIQIQLTLFFFSFFKEPAVLMRVKNYLPTTFIFSPCCCATYNCGEAVGVKGGFHLHCLFKFAKEIGCDLQVWHSSNLLNYFNFPTWWMSGSSCKYCSSFFLTLRKRVVMQKTALNHMR